jgi:hypothetical protein
LVAPRAGRFCANRSSAETGSVFDMCSHPTAGPAFLARLWRGEFRAFGAVDFDQWGAKLSGSIHLNPIHINGAPLDFCLVRAGGGERLIALSSSQVPRTWICFYGNTAVSPD